jgi:hypothetical protein
MMYHGFLCCLKISFILLFPFSCINPNRLEMQAQTHFLLQKSQAHFSLLQVFADKLVKQAYDDWINVVEYDGKTLLRFKQKKKSVATRSETAKAVTSYPVSYDSGHSQKQLIQEPLNGEQPSPRNMREGTFICTHMA